MNVFDESIRKVSELLTPCLNSGLDSGLNLGLKDGAAVMPTGSRLWPQEERNPFIMERDTAVELGGWPKESINLIASTSGALPVNGVCIAAPPGIKEQIRTGKPERHISFGRILLLKTDVFPEEEIYDYQQQVQISDIRLHLRDVMVRSSGSQSLINLRIGKRAAAEGFSLETMGHTMREYFRALPHVRDAAVILLAGDSPLYKQLQPVAENIRQITLALNTIFDDIDMDCGSCNLSEICDEVEGLREMHRRRRGNL